ncbi:hypothetical protein TNCV_4007171 [Trichonephila clavipes]|nr:hypothetical protein TNCV_4007171 [Trichonephila clavipes]
MADTMSLLLRHTGHASGGKRYVDATNEKAKNGKDHIEALEIPRGNGLEVRLLLALSTMQVIVRISSAKFPERTIDGDTTYLHLNNLDMELKGMEIFSSPLYS